MILTVVPCTVKQAAKYVAQHHRHLKREIQGALFACAVTLEPPDGPWCGVGVVANPAQEWQGTGRVQINRIATEGVRNGCSCLYGALCRAAKALGYVEVWTYTLPEEPGTSLRAAGFEDMGLSDGGEHDRDGRPRAPAERSDPKRRWRRRLSDVQPWPKPVREAKPVNPQGLLWNAEGEE